MHYWKRDTLSMALRYTIRLLPMRRCALRYVPQIRIGGWLKWVGVTRTSGNILALPIRFFLGAVPMIYAAPFSNVVFDQGDRSFPRLVFPHVPMWPSAPGA